MTKMTDIPLSENESPNAMTTEYVDSEEFDERVNVSNSRLAAMLLLKMAALTASNVTCEYFISRSEDEGGRKRGNFEMKAVEKVQVEAHPSCPPFISLA